MGRPARRPRFQNIRMFCCSAAGWATPCCSRSRGRCGRPATSVIYFAGYKKGEDLFKREDIEAATDQVIWSTDTGERDRAQPPAGRPLPRQHRAGDARLPARRARRGVVPLETVDRIIAIGSDRMMAAVKAARHGVLAPFLKKDHVGIGSINSPMQCMMKEVCAQCLQKHVDPVTGQETIVFSCFNQDQELDRVDFVESRRAAAAEHGAGEALQSLARSSVERTDACARLSRRRVRTGLQRSTVTL